jgi:hypothetical protein
MNSNPINTSKSKPTDTSKRYITLNKIVIESRPSDNFINATQLCKLGGKSFHNWFRLDATKKLIRALEDDLSLHIRTPITIDIVVEGSSRGSWIHPDLAVQLAQWISPFLSIQVSRWIRELMNTGSVSMDTKKDDVELMRLQAELDIARHDLIQKENALKERDAHINRLNVMHKELVSYKKRVTKEETVYIVSSFNYARQGIYKIGRTKNNMKFRNCGHNTMHIKGDQIKVLKEFRVNDSASVERNVHTKLKGLLLEGEREFFLCPYDLLVSVVDLVVNNGDEQNELVNKIIDTVYRLKEQSFNTMDWMSGLPEYVFNETLTLTDSSNNKLLEMNVTDWSTERKQELVAACLKEYTKTQFGINEEQVQVMWKTFQTFMMTQLNIPRSHFKATDWKQIVKNEVDKDTSLTIKWRV